jgi:hypothetical protein
MSFSVVIKKIIIILIVFFSALFVTDACPAETTSSIKKDMIWNNDYIKWDSNNNELWKNLERDGSSASFIVRTHKSLPPYRFTITGIFEKDQFTPKRIKIVNVSTGKLVQNIPAFWVVKEEYGTIIDLALHFANMIQLVDMNFDGYLDFRFLMNTGATGNNWYASFLYDPESGKFIFSRHLSSQSGLVVDAKNKQLVTYERDGWCGEFMKYYKYRNGYYIFTKIEWTDMDRSEEPGCFKITGVPKVRDIEINERRIYDPKFKDYLKKRVKIVKREGLIGSLDGRPRGVMGNVIW